MRLSQVSQSAFKTLAPPVRDVPPKYPGQPAQTTGVGIWAAEVLIDVKGKIVESWDLHLADV